MTKSVQSVKIGRRILFETLSSKWPFPHYSPESWQVVKTLPGWAFIGSWVGEVPLGWPSIYCPDQDHEHNDYDIHEHNLYHYHYDIHEHNHNFLNRMIGNFDQGFKHRRAWQVEREASEQIQHLLLQKVEMGIADEDEDGGGDDSYSGALESCTEERACQPRRRRRGRVWGKFLRHSRREFLIGNIFIVI